MVFPPLARVCSRKDTDYADCVSHHSRIQFSSHLRRVLFTDFGGCPLWVRGTAFTPSPWISPFVWPRSSAGMLWGENHSPGVCWVLPPPMRFAKSGSSGAFWLFSVPDSGPLCDGIAVFDGARGLLRSSTAHFDALPHSVILVRFIQEGFQFREQRDMARFVSVMVSRFRAPHRVFPCESRHPTSGDRKDL